jgi:alpha-soluble NSF attachment protein
MSKAQKTKGDAFVIEAKALLAKKSWFGSGTRNVEDAAETYEKAANAYKVGGLNSEAGGAYMKAAEIYRDKLSEFSSASKSLNSAGTTDFLVRQNCKQEVQTLTLFLLSSA